MSNHYHVSRDLALAGEFGRELLQTNDELRAALERHRQESARRIEVIGEDKNADEFSVSFYWAYLYV